VSEDKTFEEIQEELEEAHERERYSVYCKRCGKFIDTADHKPEHPICKTCYWTVL